jgi:hypothetical protein
MHKKISALSAMYLLSLIGCASELSSAGKAESDSRGISNSSMPTAEVGGEAPSGVSPYVPNEGENYDLRDEVYRNYGRLVVAPGDKYFELSEGAWSGFWLPSRSKYLFDGAGSPLRLWDAWIKASGLSISVPSAADWEQKNYDANPGALSWEGSCDAWAIASLYEPEPTQGFVLNDRVKLGVGAQKSLLIKSWEEVEGKRIFGRPFRGDRDSRWEDPNPAAFHRFMISELIEGERPFILDKDPGIPVWNTPIHGAAIEIRDDPEGIQSVLVHTWLKGVDPLFGNPDEVGGHVTVIELVYRLTGTRLSDGALEVQGGTWMRDPLSGVDSKEFHPDFLVGLPPKGQVPPHRSRNPGLSLDAIQRFKSQMGSDFRNP